MATTSMTDIRQACPLFFEPGAMRFFKSCAPRDCYEGPGGIFFVTSEQFVASNGWTPGRKYTVRQFTPETDTERASIDTIGPHAERSRAVAHRLAKAYAAGTETPA